MTPNPNPSPDCDIHETMRLVEYDMLNRRRDGDGFIGERKEVAAIITALRAALSPQTLPAPGEVERHHLIERLIDIATKEDGVGMSYEAPTWRGPNGARLNLYGKRASAAYWLLSHGKEIAALLQAPTLATVAAANDEGVAEQAAQFADGVAEGAQSLYDLAARDRDTVGTLIHGEAVRVAKHIAAAIRLLPQGGGK